MKKNHNMNNNNNTAFLEQVDQGMFDLMFGFDFDDETSASGSIDNINYEQAATSTSSNNRFTDITSTEVLQFIDEQENKNTKRKTKGDLELVKSFLTAKNEHRELEYIPPNQLNEYLSAFLLSVRKRDGGEYEPTTLQSYISSVDRYLKAKGYNKPLRESVEFHKTMSVLKMKQKQLKQLGKGNKPFAADPLENEHIDEMYKSETLGFKNPSALIHSLWLICTTNFGMRTGHEIHCLRWGDIVIKKDDNLGEYLQYDTERQTKTRTGLNARNTRLTKPRAYAVEQKERCPVNLFRKYADMRPIDFLDAESPFFLSVASKCPKPGQAWFKKQGMGINKIYSIMKDMKNEAGIESDKRITPYSARKRLIQTLEDNQVPSHQIVQISGHKNINSLNSYSSLNKEQSKKISDILTSNSTVTVPQPQVPVSLPVSSTMGSFPMQHQASSGYAMNYGMGNPFPMFMGNTFNAPVNFYYDSKTSQVTHTQTAVCTATQGRSCSSSPEPRRWKRIRCISDSSSSE